MKKKGRRPWQEIPQEKLQKIPLFLFYALVIFFFFFKILKI